MQQFQGAGAARPHRDFIAALADEALEAVVICPSNPFISVDPMLAIPGLRAALIGARAPVVAVSPIIGGRAVKGPTAKMMAELGLEVSARALAERYGDLLDVFVADEADAGTLDGLACRVVLASTLMRTNADKVALARIVLDTAR